MSQRQITNLISYEHPLLSAEFFPPKSDEAVKQLSKTATRLSALKPDFVSVTYGAGGSTRDKSARVSSLMKEKHRLNVMPHFTCVGATKEELGTNIDAFHAEGYRNIMALRGDPPKDSDAFVATQGGFEHAADLVAFIHNRHPDICIGVAGYPEKHPEAPSLDRDLDHLKSKVEAGAGFITTQLFFDNAVFYDFVEKVRQRGIMLPIIPGIMPVLATAQVKRIAQLCGSTLPAELEDALDKAGDDKEAVREIGTNWARKQLLDLLDNDIAGIHLYILNKADVALDLMKAFRERHPHK